MPSSVLGIGYVAVNNNNKTSAFTELCSGLTVKHPGKGFSDGILSTLSLSIESWTSELTQRITAKA